MKTKENWKTGNSTRTFANSCVATCRKLINQLAEAKEAILSEFRQSVGADEHLLRLALNEAEAIAWQTEVPHLVFPDLAAEKAQAVAAWHARQNFLRPRTSQPMFAA